METELKLAIASRDISALKAHPLLAGHCAPRELRQLDVYYDTAERDLLRHGYAMRVRSVDGKYVQTIKGAGAAMGGLHVRDEWESELADGKPDPAALARQAGQREIHALLASAAKGPLLPIFTIATERTLWLLHPADGCEVECVLDTAAIRCGKRQASMAEVELELKRGGPAHLTGLALALSETVALRIENRNKAERGYALLGGQPAPAPVKARPIELPARATLDDAFRCIVQNCLAQMEANAAGVLAQDAECLHQMRVGLRRLRAALDLFKSKVQLPAGVEADLDWLATLLGKARDWDVFLAETLDMVGGDGWSDGRLALRDGAGPHAAAAHKAVRQALQSRRYTRLVLQLSHWLSGRLWRQPRDGVQPGKLDRPARKGMRPLLDKAWRRLRKRLRKAGHADMASLHRVRIAAKKARYATEFFQSLLPAKPVAKQVRRLTALQDALGSLNDLAIGGELLGQLARDAGIPGEQAAFARGYLAALEQEKMGALGKPIRLH